MPSGRTTQSAVVSLRWSARLFGASSPSTMCSVVMMAKAMTTAMVCEPAVASDPGRPLNRGSIRCASAGSPTQPSASNERVMPSCVAARLASRLSTARLRAEAFIFPAATSSVTRLRRTATRENSAATKIHLRQREQARRVSRSGRRYYCHRYQAWSPLGRRLPPRTVDRRYTSSIAG